MPQVGAHRLDIPNLFPTIPDGFNMFPIGFHMKPIILMDFVSMKDIFSLICLNSITHLLLRFRVVALTLGTALKHGVYSCTVHH